MTTRVSDCACVYVQCARVSVPSMSEIPDFVLAPHRTAGVGGPLFVGESPLPPVESGSRWYSAAPARGRGTHCAQYLEQRLGELEHVVGEHQLVLLVRLLLHLQVQVDLQWRRGDSFRPGSH